MNLPQLPNWLLIFRKMLVEIFPESKKEEGEDEKTYLHNPIDGAKFGRNGIESNENGFPFLNCLRSLIKH